MILFFREHRPLIFINLLQMAFIPLLYWLTGEGRPLKIVLYGMGLSATLLLCYLLFRYIGHHEMYRQLQDPVFRGLETLQGMGDAPLPEAIYEQLQQANRYYLKALLHQQNSLDKHLIFMNRWVHQMKTPLSVIQLRAQMLDDSEGEEFQKEIERIRKSLEMVMSIARLKRIEHDFAVEKVSLINVVHQAIAENRGLFIAKAIRPQIDIDQGGWVYSDPKWLQFVIEQVVINALKYTVGEHKRIFFTLVKDGNVCLLEIRDQGIGIAKEDLKRVFNLYFTGERGRQYRESTGMGLYLVREVCNRLGHDVEIDSVPQEGTTVRFIFGGTEKDVQKDG